MMLFHTAKKDDVFLKNNPSDLEVFKDGEELTVEASSSNLYKFIHKLLLVQNIFKIYVSGI